jgi:hypothetical protein
MSSPVADSLIEDDEELNAIYEEPGPYESDIWNQQERIIFKSHLDYYCALKSKLKKHYVKTNVIPEIKKSFGDRYMFQDEKMKKEWSKKKSVGFQLSFITFLIIIYCSKSSLGF